MPDLTIPAVIVFLLVFTVFCLYKAALALVAAWSVLRGKR